MCKKTIIEMIEKSNKNKKNLIINCPYCRYQFKFMTLGKAISKLFEREFFEDAQLLRIIYNDEYCKEKALKADEDNEI